MLTLVPATVASLIALAVLGIGSCYLIDPRIVMASFGLNLPAPDPDTRAWLRLKGIRDVASGLLVLTLLAVTGKHITGLALLVYSVIPFGDMAIVLASGGSRSKAFSIHALTCVVMLIAGWFLFQAH